MDRFQLVLGVIAITAVFFTVLHLNTGRQYSSYTPSRSYNKNESIDYSATCLSRLESTWTSSLRSHVLRIDPSFVLTVEEYIPELRVCHTKYMANETVGYFCRDRLERCSNEISLMNSARSFN